MDQQDRGDRRAAGGRVRVERLRGVREDARRSGQRGAADQRQAARPWVRRRRRQRRGQDRRGTRGQATAVGQAAPVRRTAWRVLVLPYRPGGQRLLSTPIDVFRYVSFRQNTPNEF